jgi:DNA-binding transcriptional MerR regulator
VLTIGQLARHVGVTIKAVRHYHHLGLLPEPERDASGYRRYGADAVVALTRIKILGDAGVPLRDIEDLLAADPAEQAAALLTLDHDLGARIDDLHRRRERLRALMTGDGLYLPEEVSGLIDDLRALGLPEEVVALERDGWVLWSAVEPGSVNEWAALKRTRLKDPEMQESYRLLPRLLTMDPDDPELHEIADWFVERVHREEQDLELNRIATENSATIALINAHMAGVAPALARLHNLLQERLKLN